MSDLTQALADGMFNVLLVFETFLNILDNIPFLDSGFSLLELFYAVCLIVFFFNLFQTVITPDDEQKPEKISDEIDADVPLGI